MFDVTISVWNRFWSFQLISGVMRAGFKVHALGTTRTVPDAASYECCWTAAFATQLGHRFPNYRERFFAHALMSYEKFAAKRTGDTRCFWGWSNCHLAAFEQAKKFGVPVVLECGSTHAMWGHRVLSEEYTKRGMSLEGGLQVKLLPKMLAEYELADWICVPSRFVASTFIACGIPSSKLQVNPYGADISFWNDCRRVWRPDKRSFVFVYAAQIMLRKGIAYLLDAWKQLNTSEAELWLIGGVHHDCARLVSELPSSVRLLGSKNHVELRDIYEKADAFVLPSLEEGLARSLLEAMAAGLPLIITEETGGTDVMVDGEDGWLIPSCDSLALAGALNEAKDQPEMAYMRGQSAKRRVRPFTWTAYGERASIFLTTVLQSQ